MWRWRGETRASRASADWLGVKQEQCGDRTLRHRKESERVLITMKVYTDKEFTLAGRRQVVKTYCRSLLDELSLNVRLARVVL